MFKISKIIFRHKEETQEYKLTKNTFIYGANTVGKTAFAKVIDFVLGSSENDLKYQGLENIDSVEAELENENTKLFIRRTRNNEYFYKSNLESEYSKIGIENYKKYISCIFYNFEENLEKKDFIEVYKKIFDESITFRSFSFLNFLEEKGLGDLNFVFTKAKKFKYQLRIDKIMDFLFNYKNIEELYYKKKELEKKELKLEELNKERVKIQSILNQIKIIFSDLQIKYTSNITENKKRFREFRKNFKPEKIRNFDLSYLTKVSFSLSEEIKLYTFMKNQSTNVLDRKKKNEKLLKNFSSIIEESPHYQDYLSLTQKLLKKIDEEKIILKIVDYDKIIENLIAEKRKIDIELEEARAQATKLSYDDFQKKIIVLEHCFEELDCDTEINSLDILKEEIKNLKKEIKSLGKNYDKETIENFNMNLTTRYLNSDSTINHISEDLKIKGFKLEFNPKKVIIVASKITDKGEIETYSTGSMARQTHIQILMYLSLFEYLKKYFLGLNYLPLLIMDSANQPIATENFEKIYQDIISYANSIGIQTIFLSKNKLNSVVNDEDFIDISGGLNKFYNY